MDEREQIAKELRGIYVSLVKNVTDAEKSIKKLKRDIQAIMERRERLEKCL